MLFSLDDSVTRNYQENHQSHSYSIQETKAKLLFAEKKEKHNRKREKQQTQMKQIKIRVGTQMIQYKLDTELKRSRKGKTLKEKKV